MNATRLYTKPRMGKSMKRSLARLATAMVVTLSLSGVARAATQIEFWHAFAGTGGAALNELVDKFNASQSDVVVKPVYTGNYDEGTTKLQAALRGGTAPTLVMLEITRYGLFAARNVLAPLEPYFDKEGKDFTDSIRPFALSASKYLGHSYVLPFNVSTPVMYYNKDAFKAAGLDPNSPPKTWDELLADAKKLTLKDGDKVTQWGLNTPPQWVRWAMTNQAGGGWVDPADNSVQIDEPGSVKAYQTAADWVNVDHVASLDAALKEETAKQYFLAGNAAITFDSTGSLGGLIKDAKFDLGVAPLPCEKVCAAPIGGATLGIVASKSEAEKAAAWSFLKYVTTPENNAFIFVKTGYLPIIKGAINEPIAKKRIDQYPAYLVANDQLSVAFARARPPAMPAIRAKEPMVWQAIVLQKQTAAEALKAFAAEMKRMLAEN